MTDTITAGAVPVPATSKVARGHLRVFLGATPGSGKTFAMLREAHDRRSQGEDVVVGYVETHGRKAPGAGDRRPRGRPPPQGRVPRKAHGGDGPRRDPRATSPGRARRRA